MDEDIEAFREQVRRYIAGELSPHLDGWRRQGYIPREVWRPFGQMGFLLPEMDEEYGGAGASLAYQLVVQDELAKAEVPANTAVHTIAAHYILDYGTEAQKRRWLPKLASGEMLAGIALTEPGCGSDLKALRTRARREGDEYVIDGAKTFITNGFTRQPAGGRGAHRRRRQPRRLAGRAGDREPAGLSASGGGWRSWASMPPTRPSCSSTACACRPITWWAKRKASGFIQLMSQLPYERLLLCVPAAAVIERAVELTVEYTKQRKAFGQTLADFQNTRFKLAECATLAHVVRTFVNDCTQRLLDGTLDDEAAYMAKWWCTEQQGKVTDECLQLFGGYGYMAEYPIARLYADARVQRIYGGTTEIMKDLIARKLLA